MNKYSLVLFILVIIQLNTKAQSCLPDGNTFTTQEQIDSFQADYPGCTVIEGDVTITGDDITNLNGLNVVSYIERYLWISSNPVLTNLTGLNNLDSIGGGLTIKLNPALTSLAGLNNLTTIGVWLDIHQNDALTNLSGLNNVTSVGGHVSIYENASLTSLTGLESLNTVSGALSLGYGFFGNPSLTSLDGLENLNYIGYIFGISNNPVLTNISALHNLTSIGGGLIISSNPSLASLSGMENISCIGDYLIIGSNTALTSLTGLGNLNSVEGSLSIGGNTSLTSLNGLNNLTLCGKSIEINDNQNLISLEGLDNIIADSITDLNFVGNTTLSTCAIKSVCDYLANPNSVVLIYNNAPGCNSPEEVEAACEVGLDEQPVVCRQSSVSIYPNPSTTSITLSLPSATPSINTTLSIYNVNAQLVLLRCVLEPITVLDISALPRGIYFARITTETTVMVEKFLKQ